MPLDPRTAVLQVRFTEEELHDLRRAATSEGLKLSEWARERLLSASQNIGPVVERKVINASPPLYPDGAPAVVRASLGLPVAPRAVTSHGPQRPPQFVSDEPLGHQETSNRGPTVEASQAEDVRGPSDASRPVARTDRAPSGGRRKARSKTGGTGSTLAPARVPSCEHPKSKVRVTTYGIKMCDACGKTI